VDKLDNHCNNGGIGISWELLLQYWIWPNLFYNTDTSWFFTYWKGQKITVVKEKVWTITSFGGPFGCVLQGWKYGCILLGFDTTSNVEFGPILWSTTDTPKVISVLDQKGKNYYSCEIKFVPWLLVDKQSQYLLKGWKYGYIFGFVATVLNLAQFY
jgi:hypothetical protein